MPVQDVDAAVAVAINFGSPEEFRARPRFRDGVVASGIRPERIVGSYRVAQAVPCGIKGCGASHEHGYVVLMPDGRETNTGWDCGLDHFGMEFLSLRKIYDRVEREYLLRQSLRQRVAEVAEFRQRVRELQTRRHGGEWLLQNLRLFAKHYPGLIVDRLRENAGRGEIEVFGIVSRENLDLETSDGIDSGQPPPDARDFIRGVKIFRLDTERWPWHELELKLDEFLQIDIEHVALEEVRKWEVWINSLEAAFRELVSLIDEGKRFFTRNNLDLLPYLVPDFELREQLLWKVVDKNADELTVPPLEKPSVLKRLLMGLNS